MISYRYPLIAQEAFRFLLFLLLVVFLVYWQFGFVAALPIGLVALVCVYLCRDPPRKVPPIPLAILAPVDGRVLSVTKVHDPYLNRPANRLHISMNPWDVYSVHSPMEGKVLNQWFSTPGADANCNRCVYAQWIQSDEQDDVVLVMRPRSLARRWTRCYVQSGERIGQGQRCGFTPLGAKCELYLPEKCRIEVKAGDRLIAGTAVLATLIH